MRYFRIEGVLVVSRLDLTVVWILYAECARLADVSCFLETQTIPKTAAELEERLFGAVVGDAVFIMRWLVRSYRRGYPGSEKAQGSALGPFRQDIYLEFHSNAPAYLNLHCQDI